ncbi:hypothetical protein DL98DRAFT_267389 [Cadophora sp. DSE1049]|nr:hypothetical protein DL98DRAFT_267389 [Cadophora sp. DSE1049]
MAGNWLLGITVPEWSCDLGPIDLMPDLMAIVFLMGTFSLCSCLICIVVCLFDYFIVKFSIECASSTAGGAEKNDRASSKSHISKDGLLPLLLGSISTVNKHPVLRPTRNLLALHNDRDEV